MSRSTSPTFARRVAIGAGLGLLAGVLLIGVGFARAAFFLLVGGRIQPLAAHEVRMLAFYVAGFGVGGAVFGALRPLLHGKAGVYAGCMLVGVIMAQAVVVGGKGSVVALDAFDWTVFPALGMLLGAAAAYGWTRSPA